MRNRFVLVSLLSIVFFSCRKEAVVVEEKIQTAVPPVVQYDESRVLRAPGNYQSWNVPVAPKLVSVNGNGEYEGYINFGLPDAQFWLVKGTNWDNVTTYNETGNSTFGHNGNYFTLPDGAGVYRLVASTNSFTWSATKINTWQLTGTAANGAGLELKPGASGLSWSITTPLAAGSFRFRANQNDGIVFGQNPETPNGTPAYNGSPICIPKAGNYLITLSLEAAGNYVYGVKRL